MPYCTQEDVQVAVGGLAKLAQLSDQNNLLGGAVDGDVVAAAIAEADGEINSYVGHRYAVPLAAPPDTIKVKSAQWAARVLRRNLYNGQPLQDDLEREEIDRKWLELVAKGLVSLGIEPTPPPSSIITDKASTRDSTLSVSKMRLRGYS